MAGSILFSHLNEIGRIAENLYQVQKQSILHTKATKISEEALRAREWAINLEGERNELQKQNLALRQELARLKGEQEPEANDQYTPDQSSLQGGGKRA